MTKNEIKLIEMIRNHANPGEAFVKALEIILLILKLPGSSELKISVVSRG